MGVFGQRNEKIISGRVSVFLVFCHDPALPGIFLVFYSYNRLSACHVDLIIRLSAFKFRPSPTLIIRGSMNVHCTKPSAFQFEIF